MSTRYSPGQSHHFGNIVCIVIIAFVAGTLFAAVSGCTRCGEPKHASQKKIAPKGLLPGYTLNTPLQILTLPKKLKEASDVTTLSNSYVAIVQDEKGLIFLYDLRQQKIVKKTKFGPKGDYEGLAQVGDDMYVLKSNGTLYVAQNWQIDLHTTTLELDLPTKDNEGLCLDPFEHRLLIAPKSKWKKNKGGGKHKHPIFAFDLKKRQLSPAPAYVLNTKDIIAFAKANHLDLPGKITRSGNVKPKIKFMPSAVAVHPKTGEIYLISAAGRLIVSIDRNQAITGFAMLNESLFLHPEGIAFLPDGTMAVVNESPKKKPGLLLFAWKQPK